MFGAVYVLAALALGEPDPAALLARVDEAANRAKDATLTLRISVSERGSEPLQRTLRVWQQGGERRMVKFLDPARLRGTGILVPERGETLLYLPAYQRVRRVVGQEGGQSFMGTGFAVDDLARVRFSGDYTADLQAEAAETWTLRLKPVHPGAHRHAELHLTLRKSDALWTRIETLDTAGKVLRVIEAGDFRAEGPYTVAHRIQIDEPATGKRTVAEVTEARFDTGLDAAFFSERELRRAP